MNTEVIPGPKWHHEGSSSRQGRGCATLWTQSWPPFQRKSEPLWSSRRSIWRAKLLLQQMGEELSVLWSSGREQPTSWPTHIRWPMTGQNILVLHKNPEFIRLFVRTSYLHHTTAFAVLSEWQKICRKTDHLTCYVRFIISFIQEYKRLLRWIAIKLPSQSNTIVSSSVHAGLAA